MNDKASSAIDLTLKDANRFSMRLMLLVSIVLIAELVLTVVWAGLDSYSAPELVCVAVGSFVPLIAFFVCRAWVRSGLHSRVRYLVVGSLVVASSAMSLAYANFVWLALTIPIFVTTIYYRPRFTIATGVVVYLLHIAISAGSLYVPPYLSANVVFPVDGAVLTLSGADTLANQIDPAFDASGWIDYDRSVCAAVLQSVLDGLFSYGTVTAICVIASILTNRAVSKERDLAAKQERANLEFSTVAEMQRQMLSDVPKLSAGLEEIDIWALMDPAREVGGDFYVAQEVGDDKVGFLVADVSGKGMAAALFGSSAKTLCSWPGSAAGKGPAQMLTAANDELCSGNDAMMFVTLWLGELDLTTGVLRYCNAGHNFPVLCRRRGADSTCDFMERKSGPMLGVIPGIAYKEFRVQLEPGDAIVLYTDGVTESFDRRHEEYGDGRLLAFLDALPGELPCRVLAEALREDVRTFSDGAEQSDDITVLAIRLDHLRRERKPAQISSRTRFFAADDDNLEDVKGFVRNELGEVDLDETVIEVITACVEELFVNVNHYGYEKSGGAQCISIWSESNKKRAGNGEGRTLHLEFRDSGSPFNPLEDARDPDLGPAEQRPIGGLGIYMVRQVMDDVAYRYESGCNVIHLRKEI